MNDEQVSSALESLPREQARPGFTAAVLRRIEAPPRLPAMRWAAMTAAAAVLVLAVGLGWRDWRQRQEMEQLEMILAEKQALQTELEVLRRLTAEAKPMVYLGSRENVDVVLDLERFHRQGGFGSNVTAPAEKAPTGLRPASLQSDDMARPLRVVY